MTNASRQERICIRQARNTKQNKNFMKFESFQVGFLGNNKPEMGRAIITIANILNIVIQNSKNKTIICQ